MTDYRATPEIWRWIESFADDPRDIATAILELRARVEALEDSKWQQVVRWNSRPTPKDRQIRSSLVERVASAIAKAEDICDAEDALPEARAAIREVAAWLRENECDYNAVRWLEQEAER